MDRKQDSRIDPKGKPPAVADTYPAGPINMKKRMKMGLDVVDNPQGVGMPSKELRIANQDRKTW